MPPIRDTSSSSSATVAAVGMAGSALHTVGNLFGGFIGSAGSSSYEIEHAVEGTGHDRAFRAAVEEAKPNFRRCPKCSKWVCQATCWNGKSMLCYECAPDIEAELASTQGPHEGHESHREVLPRMRQAPAAQRRMLPLRH